MKIDNKNITAILVVFLIVMAFAGQAVGEYLGTVSIFTLGIVVAYYLYKNTKNALATIIGGFSIPVVLYLSGVSENITAFGKAFGGMAQTTIWVALVGFVIYKIFVLMDKSLKNRNGELK
jgi:hypothetical protein